MLDLVCITPPQPAILTLDEAKAQCAVELEDTGQDDLILDCVAAATEHIEGMLGKALLTQTWALRLPAFPPAASACCDPSDARAICLPLPPLQSITSIVYIDQAGDEQTLDPATYMVLDGGVSRVRPLPGASAWPSTQADNPRAVVITFVSGYGDNANAVPMALRQAAKLLTDLWFECRAASSDPNVRTSPPADLLHGVEPLISKHRTLAV